MVRAAIGLGGAWVHEHRGVAEAALVGRRQREGLVLAYPGSSEHLQLRLRVAAERDYAAARHDRILALLPEARRAADPQVLASALSLAQHCLLAPEHAGLRRTLADEMVQAATASIRPGDLTMSMLWRTVDRFLVADPHAERVLTDLEEWLGRRPHRAVEFVVRALRVMVTIRAGRLADAEALAGECAKLGEAAGDPDATGWYAAHSIATRWYQGRIGELLPHLDAQVHSPTLSTIDSSTFGALAVAAASAGDRPRAMLALGRLGGGDLRALPRSSSWLVAVYGAIEAAVLLGDPATARTGYDLLLPFARRPMMVSLGVACFGSVEHALGMAAVGMGRPDLAARHLAAAVHANLALGHWPAAVLSRYRLGQVLTCSDDRAARAEGALEQAAATAEAARHGWVLPGAAPGRAPSGPAIAPSPPTNDGAAHVVVVHRHGRRWTLRWRSRDAEVGHCVGVVYLSLLLACPGQEIPAADLAAGHLGNREVRADAAAGRSQPVLDDAARRTYRQRLGELESEIPDATGRAGDGRAVRLGQEHDWITAELAANAGPGRRDRTFAGNAERARIAVGKAIRRALDRVADADPTMGEELRRTVSTGATCCYRPPQRALLTDGTGRNGVERNRGAP